MEYVNCLCVVFNIGVIFYVDIFTDNCTSHKTLYKVTIVHIMYT